MAKLERYIVLPPHRVMHEKKVYAAGAIYEADPMSQLSKIEQKIVAPADQVAEEKRKESIAAAEEAERLDQPEQGNEKAQEKKSANSE